MRTTHSGHIVLYDKNIMKIIIIIIWDTVSGISGLWVFFCGGGCVGWGKALHKLNDNREIFEVRSPIG